MSFNAIPENKILAKISEFTVIETEITHAGMSLCVHVKL